MAFAGTLQAGRTICALLVGVLLAVGCGQSGPTDASPTGFCSRDDLEIVEVHAHAEDDPIHASDAWDKSDLVIRGTGTEEIGGARFYGGDDPEDPDPSWFEDVTLSVAIDEVLKGEPDDPDTIEVQWAAYQTETDSSESRNARLEFNDRITVPCVGQTLVFYLVDYDEPFGLRNIWPA